MPHFGINQLFLSPLKVCDLLRNRCAIYPGITVRFAPELLCDLTRILQADIKANFPYLFANGFGVADTLYDEACFGNWIVILQSDDFNICFIQDRSELSLSISPPWAPAKINSYQDYWDLWFYIVIIEDNFEFPQPKERQEIDVQYTILSQNLSKYYERICDLVSRANYKKTKEQLNIAKEESLRNIFALINSLSKKA